MREKPRLEHRSRREGRDGCDTENQHDTRQHIHELRPLPWTQIEHPTTEAIDRVHDQQVIQVQAITDEGEESEHAADPALAYRPHRTESDCARDQSREAQRPRQREQRRTKRGASWQTAKRCLHREQRAARTDHRAAKAHRTSPGHAAQEDGKHRSRRQRIQIEPGDRHEVLIRASTTTHQTQERPRDQDRQTHGRDGASRMPANDAWPRQIELLLDGKRPEGPVRVLDAGDRRKIGREQGARRNLRALHGLNAPAEMSEHHRKRHGEQKGRLHAQRAANVEPSVVVTAMHLADMQQGDEESAQRKEALHREPSHELRAIEHQPQRRPSLHGVHVRPVRNGPPEQMRHHHKHDGQAAYAVEFGHVLANQ